MTSIRTRRVEEVGIILYVMVGVASAVAYASVQLTNGPSTGGSFILIGASWFCAISVTVLSFVILGTNLYRALVGSEAHYRMSVIAAVVLVTLLIALNLFLFTGKIQLAMVIGSISLVFGPGMLLVTVHRRNSDEV